MSAVVLGGAEVTMILSPAETPPFPLPPERELGGPWRANAGLDRPRDLMKAFPACRRLGPKSSSSAILRMPAGGGFCPKGVSAVAGFHGPVHTDSTMSHTGAAHHPSVARKSSAQGSTETGRVCTKTRPSSRLLTESSQLTPVHPEGRGNNCASAGSAPETGHVCCIDPQTTDLK